MHYAACVAVVLLLSTHVAADEPGTLNEMPPYKLLRAAEDYSYLGNDEDHQYEYDWFDPIKYILVDLFRKSRAPYLRPCAGDRADRNLPSPYYLYRPR